MSSNDGRSETAIPLSCGDAWITFFLEIVKENGSTGTVAGDSHRAFDAGWNAAMRAVKATNE